MFEKIDCPTCKQNTLHEVDKVLQYIPLHRELTGILRCTVCGTSATRVLYDQYSPAPRK